MNWHDAIGILSTVALFTPVFIIVVTKLIRYKQYFSLFIYCLLAFGFNLMTEHLVNVPKNVERFYGITNNITDMPLMLGFLLFQIPSSVQKKRMKILLWASRTQRYAAARRNVPSIPSLSAGPIRCLL